MGVLSRVSRLARHLDRARRSAFAAHGLEPWEFDVLAALRRSGPPYELSPRTLLAQTLVTSGTMTSRVDKLTARGLVTRRADEHDRRAVRVVLTEQGKSSVDAALESLLAHERSILANVAPDDQAMLANLLRALVLPFDDTAE
ncbi:MarR family transcriptional regulator [Actinobacteria bacterium YIM 96077]|uniref:MarR family transcriptional regulator n=2 Tax=Phytoactinopolyspora halophila TaxID=1981511 RepID=A0A329QGL3_9ACTN|nr:MarR family transcriptional regulator [Actinobacteria bacterium YIM 96077]RAW11494.1 MarR family transcriptional regulator [Phytoactinopolyspora halophila]